MVTLYDSYRQARLVNSVPDNTRAMQQALMHFDEQNRRYDDATHEALSKFNQISGTPIVSEVDAQTFSRKYSEAESQINAIVADPHKNARVKHREINQVIGSFTGDQVVANIIQGSANASKSLMETRDPALRISAEDYARNWDTEKDGLFTRNFNEQFNIFEDATNIKRFMEPKHYDASGKVVGPASSTLYGVSDLSIDEFLDANIENLYRSNPGAVMRYDLMLRGESEEAKVQAYRDDLRRLIQPRLELSDQEKARQAAARSRAEKAAAATAATGPRTVPIATVYATNVAGLQTANIARKVTEVAGQGVRITNSTGKPISQTDLSDTRETYLAIRNLNRAGKPIRTFSMDKLNPGESSRIRSNAFSEENDQFVPGISSPVNAVVVSGNSVTYPNTPIASKHLNELLADKRIILTSGNAGHLALSPTPNGEVAAVYKARIDGNDSEEFLFHYVQEMGGSRWANREFFENAIMNLGKASDRKTRTTPYTLREIYLAGAGETANPNVEKALSRLNSIEINVTRYPIKNSRTKSTFNISLPISQAIFDPLQSGIDISGFGVVGSANTIIE